MAYLLDYDIYGLKVVRADNSRSEYAVGSDKEATKAAKDYLSVARGLSLSVMW